MQGNRQQIGISDDCRHKQTGQTVARHWRKQRIAQTVIAAGYGMEHEPQRNRANTTGKMRPYDRAATMSAASSATAG